MTPVPIADLPPDMNHVLVDFENVRNLDLDVIRSKTVHFTLLLGSKEKKLDVVLVEKLWEHAASVQLVRLTSAGRNALDFALAYYLGRAALASPAGTFHIVSKDKGYDPLVEHLRSRNIDARRHDDFSTLRFLAPANAVKPAPAIPVAAPKAKPQPKPRPPVLDGRAKQLLEHLLTPKATHPKSRASLVSFAMAHLGRISEPAAGVVVEHLRQAGHISFSEKGRATYHLKSGKALVPQKAT